MVNPRAVAIANAARADLLDRVGAGRVLIGEPARDAVGETQAEGPIAVVRPGSAEHVVATLKVGRARHFPVVVRGDLPALRPELLRDVLVLDARGLDRPPAIDISRRVVTAGAGVPLAAIDRAARKARLCLRAVPAGDLDETLGAALGAGEPGEVGLGEGSLVADVVSATVVVGGGRIARIGGSRLLSQVAWPCDGLPDPLSMVIGGEGGMAVLCEVTLRLHPAPWVAWSRAEVSADRAASLAVLSAARRAFSKRLVDTVLLDEADGGATVHVRAVTWRGAEDLDATTEAAAATFARHGIELSGWDAESQRVRLGHEAGAWPRPAARGPTLDVRVSWPDVGKVLDVSSALCADALQGDPQARAIRSWAMGRDYVRLRHRFEGGAVMRHPVMTSARHLLDAGAVPIGAAGALRQVARERMSTSTKVLTTALARAWDPDGVLAGGSGLL